MAENGQIKNSHLSDLILGPTGNMVRVQSESKFLTSAKAKFKNSDFANLQQKLILFWPTFRKSELSNTNLGPARITQILNHLNTAKGTEFPTITVTKLLKVCLNNTVS